MKEKFFYKINYFRWNKRKCDQWWEVKFVGEGIIDQVRKFCVAILYHVFLWECSLTH